MYLINYLTTDSLPQLHARLRSSLASNNTSLFSTVAASRAFNSQLQILHPRPDFQKRKIHLCMLLTHSNFSNCFVSSKPPLHPTLYFVHISACGLTSSNTSGPSKQPARTMTIPLKASASASLLSADPQSAQKVTVMGKPASWCETVTFFNGEEES
jgi:hypothetical protein